jgi:hypothetical protein
MGQGFSLVVRAAGWHTGDPGSILGREQGRPIYTSECNAPSAVSILGMDMCAILIQKFVFHSYVLGERGGKGVNGWVKI